MRVNNLAMVGFALFAFAAGISTRAGAQAYDKKYAQSLILSSGTSTAHTYTILAPTLSSAMTFVWPATLGTAPGTLYNDFGGAGLGVLSWQSTFVDPTQLAPGANNTFFTTNSSLIPAWTALNVDTTLNGNGSSSALSLNLAHSDLWTATQTVTATSTSTTPADAMVLSNTTAATSGQQQYPPRLRLSGQGWASTSSTSQDIDFILQAIPVAGVSGSPTSYLDFEDGLSNAGYSTNFETFSSGGATLGISTPTDPGSGVLNVKTGLQVNGAGTSGALLIANSSGVFVPTSITYPPSAGTAGNIVRSNGTNFISTSPSTHVYSPSTTFSTSSTTGVMMGLGSGTPAVLDTPKYSGKLLILVTGNAYNSSITSSLTVQLHYGTGSPPSAGASPTGTALGSLFTGNVYANDNHFFFSTSSLLEGLTFSTATPVWFDLEVAAPVGTANVNNVTVTIYEY